MSENSNIEWTDATWNPLAGCEKSAPGCAHCCTAPENVPATDEEEYRGWRPSAMVKFLRTFADETTPHLIVAADMIEQQAARIARQGRADMHDDNLAKAIALLRMKGFVSGALAVEYLREQIATLRRERDEARERGYTKDRR